MIKAQDGTVTSGRSMEFALDLESQVIVHPKGMEFVDKISGMKENRWRSKYEFTSFTALGQDVASDGLNEMGLNFSALWFTNGKYPEFDRGSRKMSISLMQVGNYLLGNCRNVAEAEEELHAMNIYPEIEPELRQIPPLHFFISDKSGESIVVEFIEGKMVVYQDHVGVLTNDPPFDWHVTNIRNYISVSPLNAHSMTLDGEKFNQTGQGSGQTGLPGTSTPPDRFIIMSLLKNFAVSPPDAKQNTLLAFHILNRLDIPFGTIRNENGTAGDYTQWICVKDLTNYKIWFRTYSSLDVVEVDLTLPKPGRNLRRGQQSVIEPKVIEMKGTNHF
ncbi:MAG: putative protein YxeI [Chlamydiia bacterium]|nr:putative protein YxeI [Chlamydiia bacterium]